MSVTYPYYFLSKPCRYWTKEKNQKIRFYRIDNIKGEGAYFDADKNEWVSCVDTYSLDTQKRPMTAEEIDRCNQRVLC